MPRARGGAGPSLSWGSSSLPLGVCGKPCWELREGAGGTSHSCVGRWSWQGPGAAQPRGPGSCSEPFPKQPWELGMAGAGLLHSPGCLWLWIHAPDVTVLLSVSALQDQRLVGFPSLHLHLPLRCHADVVSVCPLSHGGAAWAVGQAGLAVPSQPHVPQPALSLHRPDGLMYQMFRNQFLSFSMYQSKCCPVCWARD